MMREEELLIDVTSSADVVRIFPLFIMLFRVLLLVVEERKQVRHTNTAFLETW